MKHVFHFSLLENIWFLQRAIASRYILLLCIITLLWIVTRNQILFLNDENGRYTQTLWRLKIKVCENIKMFCSDQPFHSLLSWMLRVVPWLILNADYYLFQNIHIRKSHLLNWKCLTDNDNKMVFCYSKTRFVIKSFIVFT